MLRVIKKENKPPVEQFLMRDSKSVKKKRKKGEK
jgi:hypothetical protein